MSLMKTKPTWHRGEVIATERGWVNPQNNEVLVAIGNLKSKLEAENAAELVVTKPTTVKADKKLVVVSPPELDDSLVQNLGQVTTTENTTTLTSNPEPQIVIKDEVTLVSDDVDTTVKLNEKKSRGRPKKEDNVETPKQIIAEVVEDIVDIKNKKQIIAEVVEDNKEKTIIAE